jgi:hypothetical protein
MPPGSLAPTEKYQQLADLLAQNEARRKRFVNRLRRSGLVAALNAEKVLDDHERDVLTKLNDQSPTVVRMVSDFIVRSLENGVAPQIALISRRGPIQARLSSTLEEGRVVYRVSLPGTEPPRGR